MAVPRLTSKGQVTIPHAVRSALDLKAGDGVIFMLEGDHIVMVPVKRRSLTDLRGALRVDKRLSREDERRAVHAHVARHAMGVTLDDAEC